MSDLERPSRRDLATNHSTLSSQRTREVRERRSLAKRSSFVGLFRKVKETLKIGELKERHPDRWEQQKNAQLQQGQMEQRIAGRLREINAARHEQATHWTNELQRLDSMIDEEFAQIASLEKQLHVYRHVSQLFTDFSRGKEQLHLFSQPPGKNDLLRQVIEKKSTSMDSVDLHELCSTLNPLVQQRINQLKCIETNVSSTSSFVEIYEDALSEVNLDFTKQFVHLGNIRSECGKVRERLNECKRDVLSRRSPHEQSQLLVILDAMIAVRLSFFFSSTRAFSRVNPSTCI